MRHANQKAILILPLLLGIFLLFSLPVFATTYYVDTDADDGGDGTTPALTGPNCAWNEISDITGISPGDLILFNRTDTWREQLTVPSSGSSGNPITFGAYGSGADPIINGADLITGWTQDTEESGGVFASGLEDEVDAFTTDFTGKSESSGTCSIVQSPVNNGADSAKCVLTAQDGTPYFYKTFTEQSDFYFRFYFYVGSSWDTSANNKGHWLILGKDGATQVIRVYMYEDTATEKVYVFFYLNVPAIFIVTSAAGKAFEFETLPPYFSTGRLANKQDVNKSIKQKCPNMPNLWEL